MPNKTIYVSDADLPLFTRAVELTGGNLSAAIVTSLRRLVDVEEARQAGFEEVTVKVGVGAVERIQRFVALRLAAWERTTKEGRVETFRVYRGRTGKFVLHLERSAGYAHTAGPDGQLTGWRKHFSSEQQYGELPATSTVEVFDDLDALRDAIPANLFEIVEASAEVPEVEDLDI